jgi:hypothetical protein
MIETNTTKTRRRKGCLRAARHRAKLSRRAGRGRTVALLVFLWAFLTGPFRWPSPLAVSSYRTDRSPSWSVNGGENWPVTVYERGGGTSLARPRLPPAKGRYRTRPAMSRLMVDLRRPAARRDAAEALATRVQDPVTRAWIASLIASGEINRLSIWVRPGSTEETVISAWRRDAVAALEEAVPDNVAAYPDNGSLLAVAKLLEHLAGTETEGASARGMKPPL